MLKRKDAFTLVELLVVMAIIAILVALVLSAAGYMQRKAASSRAQAEVQGMGVALEGYKTDNGTYPRSGSTDVLNAQTTGSPGSYAAASLTLYEYITGDLSISGTGGGKSYYPIKPDMLQRTTMSLPVSPTNKVSALLDPFGNPYGYSTIQLADAATGTVNQTHGYNPTYDLWSTAGNTTAPTPSVSATDPTQKWIKNW